MEDKNIVLMVGEYDKNMLNIQVKCPNKVIGNNLDEGLDVLRWSFRGGDTV